MLAQIAIGITGCLAILLLQQESTKVKRWAPVAGLFGQPFWLLHAYETQAWGVFFVCGLYVLIWAQGIFLYWIAPRYRQRV
jgi:hypothetical protein